MILIETLQLLVLLAILVVLMLPRKSAILDAVQSVIEPKNKIKPKVPREKHD